MLSAAPNVSLLPNPHTHPGGEGVAGMEGGMDSPPSILRNPLASSTQLLTPSSPPIPSPTLVVSTPLRKAHPPPPSHALRFYGDKGGDSQLQPFGIFVTRITLWKCVCVCACVCLCASMYTRVFASLMGVLQPCSVNHLVCFKSLDFIFDVICLFPAVPSLSHNHIKHDCALLLYSFIIGFYLGPTSGSTWRSGRLCSRMFCSSHHGMPLSSAPRCGFVRL